MTEPCPPLERLRAVLDGQLPHAEQTALTRHLDGCSTCQETLERLASGSNSWQDVARQLRQAPRIEAPSSVLRQARRLAQPESAASALSAGTPNQAEAGDFPFLEPPANPTDLGQLGPYPILKLLGRGGMGLVFQGIDPTLGRQVAIKVMAPNLAASDTSRQRFLREARAAAAVRHPHVVAIHAVAESAGLPYLVMQFIAGRSLQDRLNRDGPLPSLEAARLGLQMAQGLAAAHAQGLVHRDIKPANILIEERGNQVKITDFGLARAVADVSLTQSGVIAGTPAFMSPEQARGDSIDARSDLFSLGSVLYALCTGQAPFRARQTMEVLRLVCEQTPTPVRAINPEVPDWLAGVIERLHARDPSQRFASAQEVADLLEAQLARVEDTEVSILTPRPKHRRVLPAVGVLLLLLGSGAAVFFTLPGSVPLEGEQGPPEQIPRLPQSSPEKGVRLPEPAPEKVGEVRLFEGHGSFFVGRFSPNGRLAVTAGGRDLVDGKWLAGTDFSGRIWDVSTGRLLHRLEGHTARTFAEFSPTGLLVLMTSDDRTATLWDVETGKQVGKFQHGQGLNFSAWLPDGKHVLIACGNNTVGLFEAASGQELRRFQGHTGELESVAVSPDGKQMVSASWDLTLRLWDVATGRQLWSRPSGGARIRQAVWSPDGRFILAGGVGQLLQLRDAKTGTILRDFRGHTHNIESVAFAPDGRRALSGSVDGTIRLWDVQNGQELHRFAGFQEPGKHPTIFHVVFSPDGRYALSSGWDKIARLWRLPDSRGTP